METVIAFEDLMIGVAADFQVVVDETSVNGMELWFKVAVVFVLMIDFVQDVLDPVELFGAFRINNYLITIIFVLFDIFDEQVEVLADETAR